MQWFILAVESTDSMVPWKLPICFVFWKWTLGSVWEWLYRVSQAKNKRIHEEAKERRKLQLQQVPRQLWLTKTAYQFTALWGSREVSERRVSRRTLCCLVFFSGYLWRLFVAVTHGGGHHRRPWQTPLPKSWRTWWRSCEGNATWPAGCWQSKC